nr:TauD/TfdA family dioxygenase [Nocardioides convexus]
MHPETGERAMLLGNFVKDFVGLRTDRVDRALPGSCRTASPSLENTVRWRWAPGDVAMWDNRATQHYAVADFDTQPREMRRITVQGAVPVGLDGRRSVVVQGDASAYTRIDESIS